MSNGPGRPALPATVHVLRGNPSHKSAAELAEQQPNVKVPVVVPPCPKWLNAAQRKLWDWYGERLVTAGLIAEFDVGALASLVVAHSEFAIAQALVNKAMRENAERALVDTTPSGYKQISALTQARDRIEARLHKAASKFGLSAADRIAATTGQQLSLPGMPEDPMESFLAAGDAVRNAG